jgi:hypothetical protein
MPSTFLRAAIAIVLPVIVFLGPGSLMMHLTGRDRFPETEQAESKPLNFRVAGYSAEDVRTYWTWLGEEGRLAEERFLKADLLFPIAYGGALFVGLWIPWTGLGRPFNFVWLLTPVVLTVLADWTENLVHLNQLSRFAAGRSLDADWIRVGSAATSAKIGLFTLSSAMIGALCARMLAKRSEAR